MDNQKKAGIVLIIIGICIPLIALPFVSGYDKDKGLWKNFLEVGIKIKKETHNDTQKLSVKNTGDKGKFIEKLMPNGIPFRLFFIPMFILIYIAVIKIDWSRPKNKKAG